MKKFIISLAILILILLIMGIGRLIRTGDIAGKIIQDEGIQKIGIVSVWSDTENKKYAYKEEIITDSKEIVRELVSIINSGKIDRGIKLDRLPAEYEINVYYDSKVVKCYYWFNISKYNFNMPGESGEITIDGSNMDALITGITGEDDKKKLVNPY